MKKILIDLYNEAYEDGLRLGNRKDCGESSVDYAYEKIKESLPSEEEIAEIIKHHSVVQMFLTNDKEMIKIFKDIDDLAKAIYKRIWK